MFKMVLSVIVISLSTSVIAEGIEPETVIENTISLLIAKKTNEAFDYAISSNKFFADKKADVDRTKLQFISFIQQVGSPTNCEKLASKTLIQRIRKDIYICLSEMQPFEIHFRFYKQEKFWVVQSFSYSSDTDELLDSSIEMQISNSK
ncbi:hypothetical protein [Cellvibrio sp. pealriver]|uniref:hypothetical protein n=1 Tax=Cellvibrio sp. pealriver TaxID=1622269 RepID=UPI00066FB753|nr:hypothetical protein [Cellvibrio sp. pealriver]